MTPSQTTGVSATPAVQGKPLRDRRGNVYQPAIGPRLKVLLALIFAAVAVLGATGAYLSAIRLLNLANETKSYTTSFTMWMFLVHVAVGFVIALPFLIFGFTHYATARHRKNRLAVRLGLALFITGIVVVLTGLALNQFPALPRLPTETLLRGVVFWLHILAPVVAVALYVLHRRAGPDIKWSWGAGWGAVVLAFVAFMLYMHSRDPRVSAVGPVEGVKYFFPAETRTADGKLIPARALMMDEYCMKCHQDIYKDHYHSAHHFSSFNNPAYLFSVLNTRKMGLERDGSVRASRWCAGCHDPVPFLSGKFQDPNYDVFKDPTAHAGITCVVCHAMTHVDSPMGNGAYTIEEPLHYPFAYSDNPALQWINNQLIKAKPDFHKRTFLKPFHKSAEFCSTCHKVSLPSALNHYKEFLRGQNHYDTFELSGAGHGARSFYYPPRAHDNCNTCHMPLKESDDFGSKDFDRSGKRKVHFHGFIGADTGLFQLLSREKKPQEDPESLRRAMQAHADFLRGKDPQGKKLDIDLFGLKLCPGKAGTIEGKLVAPLRPQLPVLKPGRTYLVEVVVRTLNIGHPFSQGTVDSNEIWVHFEASTGGTPFGVSGALQGKDESGPVDPWAHFINVYMLDRNAQRISRRNPEDIVIPLYNHQIPPGAGQVVHYEVKIPKEARGPIKLKATLRYRKFDYDYMRQIYAKGTQVPPVKGTTDKDPVPRLMIVDMCQDEVTLPVEPMVEARLRELGKGPADRARAEEAVREELARQQVKPFKPAWQRWNDYGIGCFLEGAPGGVRATGEKPQGEMRQAEEAFKHLAYGPEFANDPVARGNGLANLARVYNDMGQLSRAVKVLNEVKALNAAHKDKPPVPWWTVAWVGGVVEARSQHFDRAIDLFEKILDPKNQPRERNFDFTKDYMVINALGRALFDRSQVYGVPPAERSKFRERAIAQYEKTLTLDPENVSAHKFLSQLYYLQAANRPAGDSGKPSQVQPDKPLDLAGVFPDKAALEQAEARVLDRQQRLRTLADDLANDKLDRARRLQAAAQLEADLRDFNAQPVLLRWQEKGRVRQKVNEPRVPTLAALARRSRQVYSGEKDAQLRVAAARVLGNVHNALYLIYKGDDDARAIIGLFRSRPENRAASRASEPIVIYPLSRP